MNNNDLTEAFERIKQDYRIKLKDKKLILEQIFSGIQCNIADKEALFQTAHSLAGGGGMFGFEEISKTALCLELKLKSDDFDNNLIKILINKLIIEINTATENI